MEILVVSSWEQVSNFIAEETEPQANYFTRENQGKRQLRRPLLGSEQTLNTGLRNNPWGWSLIESDYGVIYVTGHCQKQ
jgi:hypothetical protein